MIVISILAISVAGRWLPPEGDEAGLVGIGSGEVLPPLLLADGRPETVPRPRPHAPPSASVA